jgi:serine/threonine protein phosphatase PrpC
VFPSPPPTTPADDTYTTLDIITEPDQLPSAPEDMATPPEMEPGFKEAANAPIEPSLPAPDTQPVPATLFIHPTGTILAERYRIVSLLEEGPGYLLYQAEDMRLCWNCGWEQGDPNPRFCEQCGMELTSHFLVNLRQTFRQAIQDPAVFHQDAYSYWIETSAAQPQADQVAPVAGYFIGYASDVGRQREIDEDSVLVLQIAGLCNRCSGPTLGLFAVADGIGGQDAGEVASRTAIQTLAESILESVILPVTRPAEDNLTQNGMPGTLEEKLVEAIQRANQAIIDLRHRSSTGSNMGCTLTVALLSDTTGIIANVGDSRTYHMHAGKLTQITRDHSVIADMVAAGEITPEEALTHEKKSIIYRCLGDVGTLEIDTFQVELEIGDRLLLCCDGLWEMVPDGLIEDILLQYTDPQAACQRLITLANEAGGEDNISVVIINIQSVT